MLLRSLVNQLIQQTAGRTLQAAMAQAAREGGLRAAAAEPSPPCDVAVVLGLSVESGGLVDLLQQAVTTRFQTHSEHAGQLHGRQVVIAESGVGCRAAAAVSRDILALHKPPVVLAAGFATGLQPELRRGHVLMVEKVVDETGQQFEVAWPAQQDASQSKALHVGRLLTVDHLVRSKEERRRLGEQHGAVACDQETMGVALACHEAGTRFLAVRIISDALDDELPAEIERLLEQNSWAARLGAATGAIWNRPSSIKDLWKLKEDALKASDRLARFLAGVIAQLPSRVC